MVPTKRTLQAKRFWSISTSFFAIGMFFLMCQPLFGPISAPHAETLAALAFIFFDTAFVLLLILHIFFPEAILLSDEQTRNAKKIYKKITITTKSPDKISNIGLNMLKAYLDELPPEIKAQLYQ